MVQELKVLAPNVDFDFGVTDTGLKIKSSRVERKVETLTWGSKPDRFAPMATDHQKHQLLWMLGELDGPTVYEQMCAERGWEPLYELDRALGRIARVVESYASRVRRRPMTTITVKEGLV